MAGTRRVFACVIIHSAFVIIAWANPAAGGCYPGLVRLLILEENKDEVVRLAYAFLFCCFSISLIKM